MAQMLAYFQLFSLVEETEELDKTTVHSQSVETLPTYVQAEYRTRVAAVRRQSVATQPTDVDMCCNKKSNAIH